MKRIYDAGERFTMGADLALLGGRESGLYSGVHTFT